MSNLPVLIVGAGPSGLMMAVMLKRLGIDFLIIDKERSKSPFSRAIAVQIRSLEIFAALDLLENLTKQSNSIDRLEIRAEGRHSVVIPVKGAKAFSRLMIIDQPHTEEVLENDLHSCGCTILRGVLLLDYTEFDHGITARLENADGSIETREFSYIVGADGAHSTVRKCMGNEFFGSTYDDAFILADVDCVIPDDHHAIRIFFKKKLFLVMIPMFGKDHYRLISVRRGESTRQGPEPSIEEFQRLADELVDEGIKFINPVWASRFFVQCRSAKLYQKGKIFLVGDAAHIHSPAGGQGMNTALQDSFNLAFKLYFSIKGFSKTALLESYHQERKPVGDFLITHTDRLFKFMVKSSPWARLVRRFVLPAVARSAEARAKLISIGSQTAIRYKQGAICTSNSHQEIPTGKIGLRVENMLISDSDDKTIDLHHLALGPFMSLWIFLPSLDANLASANRIAKIFPVIRTSTIFVLPTKPLLKNHYRLISSSSFAKPHYLLVRPDHHIFCAGLLEDIGHVEGELQKFFVTRQLTSSLSNTQSKKETV